MSQCKRLTIVLVCGVHFGDGEASRIELNLLPNCDLILI